MRIRMRIRMKYKRMASFVLLVGLMTVASVAFAHHGTANYDTSKTVTVKGAVTDFQFINPHVIIVMDGKDETGKAQKWQGELTSPNRLSRAGWTKSSIKLGDTITISGYPTKSGSTEIWIQKVVLANGEDLSTGGGN
jgi:uncharacterized protein DUF6152